MLTSLSLFPIWPLHSRVPGENLSQVMSFRELKKAVLRETGKSRHTCLWPRASLTRKVYTLSFGLF